MTCRAHGPEARIRPVQARQSAIVSSRTARGSMLLGSGFHEACPVRTQHSSSPSANRWRPRWASSSVTASGIGPCRMSRDGPPTAVRTSSPGPSPSSTRVRCTQGRNVA
ncbi:hypothetical protein [Serinicoccus profundi]|uniref:hypothetical protein n=1 Tax=Serinicoccus profundi TaxID=1078471 RepID=UPI003B847058